MKTFLLATTLILLVSNVFAADITCKTEEAAVVSADGDFDQITFKVGIYPDGTLASLEAHYKNLERRNVNDDCSYDISLSKNKEASVALACSDDRFDRGFFTTLKLQCE